MKKSLLAIVIGSLLSICATSAYAGAGANKPMPDDGGSTIKPSDLCNVYPSLCS